MNNRQKIAHSGVLLLMIVGVITFGKSYGFFTSKEEYHGKVNMTVGTLDYKIDSIDLNNNSISLQPNEEKAFYIDVTSLNTINSKYGLVYSTNCNNLDIGYINLESLPTGVINSNETKRIVVKVKNNCNTNTNVTLNVEGGFIHNDLITNDTSVSIEKNIEAIDIESRNNNYQECSNVQCHLDNLSNLLD